MTRKTKGRGAFHEGRAALQKRRAAFQGELGAFSHAAAEKLLGRGATVLPCPTFKAVFAALDAGEASHAAVPIENTLHGSVHENYDNLLESGAVICGETSIRIEHHLIALPGVTFKRVTRAFSHPVAINQCRTFFEKNPQIDAIPFYDTAGSVKMLRETKPGNAAAIASGAAAALYGGNILRRNIEDNQQNFTRFFLLTKQQEIPAPTAGRGKWKTSLVFSAANEPGALFKAMACFALRDLNLTKIESRPLRGKPWEYLFYVDLMGRETDTAVRNALANLQEITDFLKVLGSYRET